MWGIRSLGYWSRKTINSSSFCCNNDEEIPEEEFLEVSLREESCVHRYLENIHYSSSNLVGHKICVHMYQETSHSTSSNNGGRGNRSSLTSHYSSHNNGGYVDRGGSMSLENSKS